MSCVRRLLLTSLFPALLLHGESGGARSRGHLTGPLEPRGPPRPQSPLLGAQEEARLAGRGASL